MSGNKKPRERRQFGTIRQLHSGRYQARYRGPDGVLRSAPTTFRTKRDANAWLVQTQAEILRQEWVDPDLGKVSLKEYSERWVRERELSPRTRELYAGLLRNHINPYLGTEPLVDLSPAKVRTWRQALLDKAVGRVTVAKSYRLLKAVLTTAADDDELIRRNPCRIKGAGQEKSPERPTATLPEVFAIAAKIQPRYSALILLATFASLRFGELLGLRRRDLDLDGPRVRVRIATGQMNSGEVLDGDTKSEAGKRWIALPEAIVPLLKEHLDTYAQAGADGRLFIGPEGGIPRRSNFNRIWKKTLKAAGVNEALHLHDLRHTGGTLAANSGASLRDLMARLGHSSPRAALIYLHTNNTRDRQIAEALNVLMTTTKGSGLPLDT